MEFLQRIRALTGKTYQVGMAGPLLYPVGGASDDWAKHAGIDYVYTVELRDQGEYGFLLPADQIIDTSKEAHTISLTVIEAIKGWSARHNVVEYF